MKKVLTMMMCLVMVTSIAWGATLTINIPNNQVDRTINALAEHYNCEATAGAVKAELIKELKDRVKSYELPTQLNAVTQPVYENYTNVDLT